MDNVQALRDLAAKWVLSGESARTRRGNDAVASTLIGCAQALRNLLPAEDE